MNVSSWLAQAKIKSNDAGLILLSVIDPNLDQTWLVLHGDDELSSEQIAKADALLVRRAEGEPLAYLLGYKDFYGFKFAVDRSVLIPRPETEMAIDLVRDLRPKTVLDVGTGSGCIAVTLQKFLLDAKVEACDIEDKPLFRQNSRAILGFELPFYKSDLLTNISKNYDVIVANLPYVDRNWDFLSDSLKYEPESALYAEDGGLALIKRLIIEAKGRCKYLVLESDPCQQDAISEFAAQNGYELVKKAGYYLIFGQ